MPITRRAKLQQPEKKLPGLPRNFRKAEIKRAVDAVRQAGLDVCAVDVLPDRSISIRTSKDAARQGSSAFDQWSDRL